MFIQTEATPNPLSLKFLPGKPVMPAPAAHERDKNVGTAFYTSKESAANSPLALALFGVPDVAAVFFGADFISVTKTEPADWAALKPMLLSAIMDHFIAGKPVIQSTSQPVSQSTEDSEIVRQIKELIDTRVRPAVAMDGGDIIYKGFHDGIVQLELHGACSGCPSSSATLKSGIENMLKHYVPEVIAVEAVS